MVGCGHDVNTGEPQMLVIVWGHTYSSVRVFAWKDNMHTYGCAVQEHARAHTHTHTHTRTHQCFGLSIHAQYSAFSWPKNASLYNSGWQQQPQQSHQQLDSSQSVSVLLMLLMTHTYALLWHTDGGLRRYVCVCVRQAACGQRTRISGDSIRNHTPQPWSSVCVVLHDVTDSVKKATIVTGDDASYNSTPIRQRYACGCWAMSCWGQRGRVGDMAAAS
jgi:hypothetical protein